MPSIHSLAQPSANESLFVEGASLVEEQDALTEGGWIDAVDVSEDELRELLKTKKPLRFDWENKWLRGD